MGVLEPAAEATLAHAKPTLSSGRARESPKKRFHARVIAKHAQARDRSGLSSWAMARRVMRPSALIAKKQAQNPPQM